MAKKAIITYTSKTTGLCLSVDHTARKYEVCSYYGRKILVDSSYMLTPQVMLGTDKELRYLENTLVSYGYTKEE